MRSAIGDRLLVEQGFVAPSTVEVGQFGPQIAPVLGPLCVAFIDLTIANPYLCSCCIHLCTSPVIYLHRHVNLSIENMKLLSVLHRFHMHYNGALQSFHGEDVRTPHANSHRLV